MRIAQVAPLFESVPPRLYGGTERVVSYLTEELVRAGHDVTLFASGDSKTRATLVPMCASALRLDPDGADSLVRHILMAEEVAARAREFDVIHYHVDYIHFPTSRRLSVPHLTTLHGRLDLPDLRLVYERFRDMPVAAISAHQRAPLPMARWIGTVHHGLPPDQYVPREAPGEYFAFLGRISPEKRVDRAVEIAVRSGWPLKIAAKVNDEERSYFKTLEKTLNHPLVEFVGEIGESGKGEFLSKARALLFPIDWPEPFGLVMIEAMACGTPVLAFRRGSVPEVVEHGVTGFVVDGVEQAVQAAARIGELDRREVRKAFERRFSARRMAEDYLALYRSLARRSPLPEPPGELVA
jgi:glycosyltransferase involved in cell wall biosynthesis